MLFLLILQVCVFVLYTPSPCILVEHVMSVGTRTHNRIVVQICKVIFTFSSSFVCICVCNAMRLRCLEIENCESLSFVVVLAHPHLVGEVKVNIYPQTKGEFKSI